MSNSQNGPLRLDDHQFTTADVCRLSGVPDRSLRNWLARETLPLGRADFTGRRTYCLLDAIRLAAMHDLTLRVPLKPTDAVGAAELVVRQVREHSLDGLADPNAVPRTRALAMAVINGETQVGLVDPAQPGGYMDFAGPWGRAHVVLPIAALAADVLWRALDILAARAAPGAPGAR